MRWRVGKDEKSWVDEAWTWIHAEIQPRQRVFVPAGGTPEALYKRWQEEPSDLLKSLTLVQLDEIITGPKQGEFHRFFEKNLPGFMRQMEWIEDAEKTADVAILGVGVNGHVAFHEPGLAPGFCGGCVRLSEETLGYLGLGAPTWGLTYGVANFLKANKILVLVRGERKRAVMQKALAGDRALPITHILNHPNVTVVSDFPAE
ncbi:MAG: 6-phosphogluconolactonase [Bdellovibrionales bacterium]